MKKCKLLLALSIVLMMPFFALKETKATTSIIEYRSSDFAYGRYVTYYAENNGSYVITDMFDIVNVPMNWEQVTITKIDFDNVYSGYMEITLAGNINTNLWEFYLSGDGASARRVSENNKIAIYLDECHQFYIYAFCANDNDINFVPSSFSFPSGALTPQLTSTELQIRYKYFSYENLMLYLWAKSYGDFLDYPPTDIPFIKMTNNDQSYTEAHHIQIVNGTNDFYILTSQGLISNRWSLYWRTTLDSRATVTMTQFKGFPNGLYIHRLRIENPGGINYFDLELLPSIYCYPVYYSQGGHIPDNVALLLQTDYNNTYTDLLKEIRDALNGNPNITPVDPDVYSDTSTAISNTNNVETSIQGDFSNAMNNINLNDYGIGSTLYQSMVFLTDNLQQIFNKSGEFKILFTLPLVLGIALFFIGRGSVVFRQGNIDRAEFRNDMKNYHANEEADRIMGYEGDSRATNVAAGRVSHSRIIKRK